MRIVDRATFLTLPSGTIYAKFNPYVIEAPAIKWESMGADFVTQDLVPSFEGCTNGEDVFAVTLAMAEEGKESPPVDYDCAGRDGLFDLDQLFAVWTLEDAKRLIARLQTAVEQLERQAIDNEHWKAMFKAIGAPTTSAAQPLAGGGE
jgi:hypothetical protein